MAQLFRLQDKRDELVQLWDNAPPMLKEKLDQNYVEISLLLLGFALEQGLWNAAFDLAMTHVRDVIDTTDTPRNSKNDPLVKSWKLWGNLLEAEKHMDLDDVYVNLALIGSPLHFTLTFHKGGEQKCRKQYSRPTKMCLLRVERCYWQA